MKRATVIFATNRFSPVLEILSSYSMLSLQGIVYVPLPQSCDRRLIRFAAEKNIPCFHSFNEYAASRSERPDFLAVYALHVILSADETAIPKIAALNLHPSMLPLFKGKNPWSAQFQKHVVMSGFTVHRITPEVDSGEIIAQKQFVIDYSLPEDVIINNALRQVGGELLCHSMIKSKDLSTDAAKDAEKSFFFSQ